MKNFTLLFFLFLTSFGYAQINLPLDFEMGISTNDFTDFDGGVGTVIPNPQSNGVNPSTTVGQIVRNGGQIWAGSKITFSNTFDFTSLGGLSMKVFTDAPAGTQIKLKLEGGVGEFVSDAVTKTSGTWETLIWDFSTAPLDKTDLVFMFDYNFIGDGTSTSTFLFDDIQQVSALPPVNLDIDFEASSTVTSDFTNFNGGVATVIPNPQSGGSNTSATVGQIVRNGGEVWAGSKLILAQNLDFSSLGYISIDIFSTTPVGTSMQLKIEGSGEPVIQALPSTTSGEWETFLFDLTGTPSIYNTLVFMFDIGNIGDGSSTSTFLFDNIQQTDGTLNYVVNTSSNPMVGGTTSGDGSYSDGASVTVSATANNGYTFVDWTENGNQVSTDASYIFTISADRNLVANFSQNPITYTVSTSSNPTAGGTTTGDGSYDEGTSVTVSATANTDYIFVDWTENGNQVSTDASYTFTISADRNLVANFDELTHTYNYHENSFLNIYPNPSKGKVIIETAIGSNLRIFNYLGQSIHSITTSDEQTEIFIEKNGTYILSLFDENGNRAFRKVVIAQ